MSKKKSPPKSGAIVKPMGLFDIFPSISRDTFNGEQIKNGVMFMSIYVGQYDKLMAEQSRWLRKQTIANNKLADVRKRIDRLVEKLAHESVVPKGSDAKE